jgi:hypothetical protein
MSPQSPGVTSGLASPSSPLQYVKGPQSRRTTKEIVNKGQNVKYHKGKALNFQTHRRVVVLISSNLVRGISKHPRRVRNQRCRLWWDVHHTQSSPKGVPLDVRLPCRVVVGLDLLEDVLQHGSQPSTYTAPSQPRKNGMQLPSATTHDELNIFVSV